MSTATQSSQITDWKVDPIHSSVGFAVRHMVVSTFRGTFDEFEVSIDPSGDEARLSGVVPVRSINVDDEQLEGHLLSADFFDAENHPEIRYDSIAVESRDGDEVTVVGDLTIKGHTERVTATGTISHIEADAGGGERYGVSLEAKVDRRAFGLNWNQELPKGGYALGNDVTLSADLELVPKEQG